MKRIKTSLICLIIGFFLLPFSNLTAQSTTTLGAITEQKRQQELEKRELRQKLANPEPASSKAAPTTTNSKKNNAVTKQPVALTEADIRSIQKRIDAKKATLAAAKSTNSLDAEDQEELKRTIEKEELVLKNKKRKQALPVAKSN